MKLPPTARLVMQAIVGVALGAAFDSTLWDKILRFPLTVSALLVFTAAATGASILFLRKFAGYGATTSFFAAVPGGCVSPCSFQREKYFGASVGSCCYRRRILRLPSTTAFQVE